MPAYVIAYAGNVRDPEAIAEYRRRNTDAVANHGGRFAVRGGEQELLEGDWPSLRIVVIEFPDMDAARAWYDSPAYLEARAQRAGAATGSLIAVEGV